MTVREFGRPYGNDDETVMIEGRIVGTTMKALLVRVTNGQPVWIPRSQLLDDPDGGLYHSGESAQLRIPGWLAREKGLTP